MWLKQNSTSFDNISFILDDAEKFKLDSKFDYITGIISAKIL